jgi:hypothetical protein
MLDHVIRNVHNPLDEIKIDLGSDIPLQEYIKKAIQDIEIINILGLNPIKENGAVPFIKTCNWDWDPHPTAEEIQYRRRETKDNVKTKYSTDTRIGILSWDMYVGALDKNGDLETVFMTGDKRMKVYVPIADEKGRFLLDNVCYPQYQLVDKLLYPKGKKKITLKSLLPIDIVYKEKNTTSMDGYIVTGDMGLVKIFRTMEPIMSCFMHLHGPLHYLELFPIVQFVDEILDDKDEYEYFQPIESKDIYVKAFRKGIEEFEYVRSCIIMLVDLIGKYDPPTMAELKDPEWWVYTLSYYEDAIAHRGACHQMYVARMLDTISAQILPIPGIDKRNMTSLLRYVLQSDLGNVNVLSFENKRLRMNETISTIMTAEVSSKLKRMFKYGTQLKLKEMLPILNFKPGIILSKMYSLQTIRTIDFANDNDIVASYRFTKAGPNSLGAGNSEKIGLKHRQLHHSMIGVIDLFDISKDVGQSGTLSPWGDMSVLNNTDINRYPNIKFDLWKFKERYFPNKTLVFNATDIVDYNNKLDKLALSSYINISVGIANAET